VLYIAESRKSCIVFKDLTGQTVVDPNKLTVPQLRKTLKEAGAWDDSDNRKKKKPLKDKLQQVLKERLFKRGSACSNKLQMENNIQNPLALIFDKDGYLFTSTKQGTVFKIKVESDLVSLKGVVIAQIAIGCGLLYGLAILNDVLYVASYDDDGGVFTINFQEETLDKVLRNGEDCSKIHSLTVYDNKLLFSDDGDHSLKVWNPVTHECRPHSANGKGTRDGKSAQFVQPTGVFAERKTVFVLDSSTGCLRMTSEVPSLVNFLSSLQEFCVTFGLHLKKQKSTPFTIDTAITRIQEVYDFDCQCIEQVKAFLETTAQTQGPQGTISSVVVEDERKILLALKEIPGLFQKYAPQLLKVFKLKCLLTLVVENFFLRDEGRGI
jgi:hypothetical protein